MFPNPLPECARALLQRWVSIPVTRSAPFVVAGIQSLPPSSGKTSKALSWRRTNPSDRGHPPSWRRCPRAPSSSGSFAVFNLTVD